MKARFEVSTEGMRALQAGREPWQLAKELVSNAWDEAITRCEVKLVSISPRKARLEVYDDGAGFTDIKDAWTLMGHTPKRGNPNVRGRFNIGEKEILSVADSAVIHTKDSKVIFPKTGGRLVRKADMIKGTKITCVLPWGNRQAEDVAKALKLLIVPKGITYVVNGDIVPSKQTYKEVSDIALDTVLQDAPGEPMRNSRRKTSIELYKTEKGMLYEMGIPIQSIGCKYLVNVMQKVPLPPNRDVVRDSYLQDIYRIVLEATKEEISEPSATWVRQAVEDKEVTPEAVKAVIKQRYGDKVVLRSSDTEANERAERAGYIVVHPRTLSPDERSTMQESAGLVHSSDRFPSPYSSSGEPIEEIPEDKWTDGMRHMAKYVSSVGKALINVNAKVCYYRYFRDEAAARWDGSGIRFNMAKLSKAWFDDIGEEQTGLIVHEMAHCQGNGHNWEYQKSFERLAGKAIHLALEKPEIFSIGKEV